MKEDDKHQTDPSQVPAEKLAEPPNKRMNFLEADEEDLLEGGEAFREETTREYLRRIDPSQPSTSNLSFLGQSDLFSTQNSSNAPNETVSLISGRNRLRAPRDTSSAIAEAALKNGMQTINRSGSRFVVPITMQAHPTRLNDRILDEKDDILSQHEAFPYCCHCHSIVKTWRGFEYHVLREHIKYRAYRCYHCQKECFYTEEEGRFHLSTHHPKSDITLMKEYDANKETAARSAFKHIFLMCRDGPEVTRERVFEWEEEAAQQVMKFPHLKFKRPVVVTKKPPTHQKEAQTELTSVQIMVQPVMNRAGRLYQNIPMSLILNDFHQGVSRVEYPPERLPGTLRPRSTATQHDEDPRDREKFFREWPP